MESRRVFMRTRASGLNGVLVLLACAVWLFASVAPARAAETLPDQPLPLFDGGTLRLGDLGGRVVVVRFAASW
jgi:hypothetical protein